MVVLSFAAYFCVFLNIKISLLTKDFIELADKNIFNIFGCDSNLKCFTNMCLVWY